MTAQDGNVSRGTDPQEEVEMRLKPSEVRIVNAVRGLRKGRIIVTKLFDGRVEVDAKQHLEGLRGVERDGGVPQGTDIKKLRG